MPRRSVLTAEERAALTETPVDRLAVERAALAAQPADGKAPTRKAARPAATPSPAAGRDDQPANQE